MTTQTLMPQLLTDDEELACAALFDVLLEECAATIPGRAGAPVASEPMFETAGAA